VVDFGGDEEDEGERREWDDEKGARGTADESEACSMGDADKVVVARIRLVCGHSESLVPSSTVCLTLHLPGGQNLTVPGQFIISVCCRLGFWSVAGIVVDYAYEVIAVKDARDWDGGL